MKQFPQLKLAAAWLACLGMFSPTAVFGQAPASAPPAIRDVALTAGNTLSGRIVDVQGQSHDGTAVTISRDGQSSIRVSTDASGYFRATGLPGGVYSIVSDGSVGTYRLWSPGTAPPSAGQGVMMVSQSTLLRGQCNDNCCPSDCNQGGSVCGQGSAGGLLGLLANPWFAVAAGATAIAVPLTIDDDDGDAS